MKAKLSKVVAMLLCVMLCAGLLPLSALADWNNTTYAGDTFGTNGYYKVISQKDYTLVPGAATETEMVLNNADGSRRQVIHVIEVDPSNPDVSIIPGYYNIDKLEADPADSSAYKAAGVTAVAAYYEDILGYNVVGAMNTDLDYTDNAPRVLVYNGKILSGYAGASAPQSVLYVWQVDGKVSCQVTAYNKAELEAGVANGTLLHAISVSFGMVVKDGKLVNASEVRGGDDAARSMVGVKEDGTLVMVMNDGRGSNNSKGFNSYEEGECMLALGCKWAANCDGGGSSSIVTRRAGEGNLVCRCIPCDGAERPTKSSLMVVSNVAATGNLDTVNITSGYDYFAPNTTYTFGTNAVDTHGYSMELPADATWALSDASFGTIEDGTFISNGKIGTFDVQILLNGSIVGSRTITVENPTTLQFAQASTVLPYGKSTTLEFVSFIGESKVYLDGNSFAYKLSDNNAGTLNGLVFTATSNESVASVVVTATYLATGKELNYTITFGKGSEIVWDFEDGALNGFLGQQDAYNWQKEHGVETPFGYSGDGLNTLINKGQISTDVSSKAFVASAENGGQVHNGNYSLGYTFDMTQVAFNEWTYCVMYNISNINGDVVLRDVANGKKATTIGCWVYVPVGFYTAENSGALALQANLFGGASKESAAQIGLNLQYNGKNLNALTENDIPENRWVYVSASIAGYNYVSLVDPLQTNFRSPSVMRMYVKPSVAQVLTYYFDDFTLDYSSAVDDRIPPVISNPQYATSDTNIAFNDGVTITDNSAAFTATISDANSGIDESSAAIYIDGNKVTTTKVVGSTMFCDNIALGVGTHKVKFEIADKLGNYTTLTKTIISATDDHYMKYRTRIELRGHNDSGNKPIPGSVYYIDVISSYADNLGTVVATLELNSANTWILEQLKAADGYNVTYSVDGSNPNKVTFTCTSSKSNSSGTVMFSVPVRVYNPLVTNGMSDGSAVVVSGKSFKAPLSVEMTACTVNDTYGNYFKYSVAELDAVRTITRHEHDAAPIADKAPTCNEAGYTGRTYCDACESVVEWGETISALGHSYELVDGVLICTNCNEPFNGVFTDGRTYFDGIVAADGWDEGHTHYYVDGTATVGQLLIDGAMCTFDANGVYQPDFLFAGFYKDGDNGWMYFEENVRLIGWVGIMDDNNTVQWYYFKSNGYAATDITVINGMDYKFIGEQGKCIGAWNESKNGTRFYFCKTYYKNVWVEIEGSSYYFDNNGYRYEGTCAVSAKGEYIGAWEFDSEGRFIQNINGVFTDARNGVMHYAVNGELQKCGLFKIDGDYYYARSNYALVVNSNWYVDKGNGFGLPGGSYAFGADGKMLLLNGIVDDNGVLRYYINGVPQSGLGLVEIDGDYYYVRSNGALVVNASWYVDKNNSCGMPYGVYQFGADGKMILTNGIVSEDGKLYYYINGVPQSGLGLVEIDSDYYYVRSNGTLVVNASWYVDKSNSFGLPYGTYQFGEDGKMLLTNGVADVDGTLHYYINGVPQNGLGLVEIDGDYYYVRSNGIVVSNASWYVDKNNSFGLPAGTYQFGTDGKMILTNGIVNDNGILRYYVDGIPQSGLGLIMLDGDYYYVRSNGVVVSNASWYVDKNNKHGIPAGTYQFDAYGKMIID